MVDYRSFGDRPAVRSARESAERWILAVLLAEPGRWHGLVDRVHVTDFTADDLRRVAEIYWQHQQDEGEPVFNEFLDQLRAASEAGVEGGVDLAGLAVELVADLDAMTGPSSDDKPGMEVGRLLTDAVSLLEEMRAGGERDKLVADLRRTSDAEATTPPAQVAAAAAESLRQLQERARRPDLRRVGS
jgi:hypothetical protein